MRLLIIMQVGLVSLFYTKSVFSYLGSHKKWTGCPYPLDTTLLLAETGIYVNFVELLASQLLVGFEVCYRVWLLMFLPLTQVAILVFCVISIVLYSMILCQCSSCVMIKQLPVSNLHLVLSLTLLVHLWVFSAWASFKLLTYSARPDYSQIQGNGGLSYRQIMNISTTIANSLTDCSICLESIVPGEVVKVLPRCFHMFHVRCIEPWLLQRTFCPYCRSEIQRVAD